MALVKRQIQHEGLTKRSIEILSLLAEGLSDREIAERLVMTINTIKWYNRQIYGVLGVGSRTQAIARAHELRLLDEDDQVGPLAAQSVFRAPRHNLPQEPTPLVGRTRELTTLARLMSHTRLLTLVGPPGTGKTRLALHVAHTQLHEFRNGVYFVSLAPISHPTLVLNSIASAVGINQAPEQTMLDTLKHVLAESEMLLVLDNFEHVLDAAPDIAELLAAAPRLKVLATSREPLHLYGEQEYAVPPLELPHPDRLDLDALADCEAIALFLQQARAVRPDFQLTTENALDIAKICVRLEGLPLVIELAAARIKLLSPRVLLERLSNRLDTLTGGAQNLPVRQQTLRNTIEWSYHLLDEGEKVLFARLAVFAGGWTLEAAENICGHDLPIPLLDGLASLLDKSLIQQVRDASDGTRFMMLETIREYALQCLRVSGEEQALRARHADWFTDFAETTGSSIHSGYRAAGLTSLETEHNNFRAVLGWSLDGNPEPGLRLIAALGMCWRVRSYLVEGYHWAQQLLKITTPVAPEVRAHALASTSRLLACYLGKFDEGEQMAREAIALGRQSGDELATAKALYALGTAIMKDAPAQARVYVEEAQALFQALGDEWGIANSYNVLGEAARIEGDYDTAKTFYLQALPMLQRDGNLWEANVVLTNLAYVAVRQGDCERACALFMQGLANSQELGDKLSIANCLAGLAGVHGIIGQAERAAQILGAVEAMWDSMGAALQPGDRADYERNLTATRAQLDDAAFTTAWASGRSMTLAAAIAFALEPKASPAASY
jgi:predicted ATPase/DNA-binding CsgD family transcriptional regulator